MMEPEVLLNVESSSTNCGHESSTNCSHKSGHDHRRSSLKQKRARYDLQTKYQLLQDIDSGMSYNDIMNKYGLPTKSNISGELLMNGIIN